MRERERESRERETERKKCTSERVCNESVNVRACCRADVYTRVLIMRVTCAAPGREDESQVEQDFISNKQPAALRVKEADGPGLKRHTSCMKRGGGKKKVPPKNKVPAQAPD